MNYLAKEATGLMRFEIRHVTRIKQGNRRGHFQVGLSLVSEDNKSVGLERAS